MDFFTYSDSFNKREILEFVKCFKRIEIINEANDQIDIICDGVKITFFNAIVTGLTYKLFYIALTYIDDIEDDSIFHLEPVEIISRKEIRTFFEDKLAEPLKKNQYGQYLINRAKEEG